jgi:hypothetical protein
MGPCRPHHARYRRWHRVLRRPPDQGSRWGEEEASRATRNQLRGVVVEALTAELLGASVASARRPAARATTGSAWMAA